MRLYGLKKSFSKLYPWDLDFSIFVKLINKFFGLVVVSFPLFSFSSAASFPCTDAYNEDRCEEAVYNVEAECKGMDMASYAMVGQAVQGATSSAQSASARTAQYGSAAINTAVAGAAMKRCMACKKAMRVCEKEACSKDRCETCTPSNITNKQREINTCKSEFQERWRECKSFKTYGDQACLQAGISGLQAATALMAARALGNCPEGAENCVPQEEKEIDEMERQEKLQVGWSDSDSGYGSFGGLSGPEGYGDNNSSPNEPLIPPDSEKKIADKDEEKEGSGGLEEEGVPDSSSDSLAGLVGSSASKGVKSQPFNYGKKTAGLGGSGLIAGNSGYEEEEYEDEEDYPRDLSSKGAFGGSGSGSSGYAAAKSQSNGRRRYRDSGSLVGNKKLAMNNKKKDTFGKGKSGDTIFSQMSRFITKVCYREMRCP